MAWYNNNSATVPQAVAPMRRVRPGIDPRTAQILQNQLDRVQITRDTTEPMYGSNGFFDSLAADLEANLYGNQGGSRLGDPAIAMGPHGAMPGIQVAKPPSLEQDAMNSAEAARALAGQNGLVTIDPSPGQPLSPEARSNALRSNEQWQQMIEANRKIGAAVAAGELAPEDIRGPNSPYYTPGIRVVSSAGQSGGLTEGERRQKMADYKARKAAEYANDPRRQAVTQRAQNRGLSPQEQLMNAIVGGDGDWQNNPLAVGMAMGGDAAKLVDAAAARKQAADLAREQMANQLDVVDRQGAIAGGITREERFFDAYKASKENPDRKLWSEEQHRAAAQDESAPMSGAPGIQVQAASAGVPAQAASMPIPQGGIQGAMQEGDTDFLTRLQHEVDSSGGKFAGAVRALGPDFFMANREAIARNLPQLQGKYGSQFDSAFQYPLVNDFNPFMSSDTYINDKQKWGDVRESFGLDPYQQHPWVNWFNQTHSKATSGLLRALGVR